MANGFKYIGEIYVSKAGSNNNAGTLPDFPRASLTTIGTNQRLILGAGVYDAFNILGNTGGQLIGDGATVIRPAAPTGIFSISGQNTQFYNIRFERCFFSPATATTPSQISMSGCTLVGCTGLNGATGNNRHRVCSSVVAINCDIGSTGIGSFSFRNSIAINSIIRLGHTVGDMTNSYIDPTSEVPISSVVTPPTRFRNNNVQGVFTFYNGTSYRSFAIQDQFVGTPQDNGYAIKYGVPIEWLTEANLTAFGYTGPIPGWDVTVSTFMNRDPQFLDAPNEVYWNSTTSPHLFAGTAGYNHIGLGLYENYVNADNGDARGTVVIPSAEIDTTDPANFKLLPGQSQGYVDYIIQTYGKRLATVKLKALFEYNSSVTPGTTGNRLVPDSQPLNADYPSSTLTTVVSADTTHVTVAAGVISVGQFVKINGRDAQVLSKINSGANDTLALSAAMVSVTAVGTPVTYSSSLDALAALSPNRLTYLLRVKTTIGAPTVPMVDAEWDNGLDPGLGFSGQFVNNEIYDVPSGSVPGCIVGDGVLYGTSDAAAPVIPPRQFAPQWINVRVYIRNNYRFIGQP